MTFFLSNWVLIILHQIHFNSLSCGYCISVSVNNHMVCPLRVLERIISVAITSSVDKLGHCGLKWREYESINHFHYREQANPYPKMHQGQQKNAEDIPEPQHDSRADGDELQGVTELIPMICVDLYPLYYSPDNEVTSFIQLPAVISVQVVGGKNSCFATSMRTPDIQLSELY